MRGERAPQLCAEAGRLSRAFISMRKCPAQPWPSPQQQACLSNLALALSHIHVDQLRPLHTSGSTSAGAQGSSASRRGFVCTAA